MPETSISSVNPISNPISSATRISPAKITSVVPGSIAEEIGFEAGDRLVSIN
ncbi:MAG: PDZ domain-containing protein, partial [Cyanobacteria bacterium J06635_11]